MEPSRPLADLLAEGIAVGADGGDANTVFEDWLVHP
jgi:hypothetical protein